MALVSVVLLALFVLALARILGVRATVSNRTLFAFLALGALLGPVSYQVANRFFDPYTAWGSAFSRNLVIFFASHLIVLLPVFAYFIRGRVHFAASVADAFLLGFATGLGYDLVCALLGAANATQPLQQLNIFPPFTFAASGNSLAGYGYWSALGALAMAAGLRFLRNRYVAFAIAGLVILFFAAEQAALLQPPETPGHWFGLVTLHGALTPYLAVVALVACSFLEYRWVSRLVPSASPRQLQVLADWQALLNALFGRRFQEFRQLGARQRLERNAEIARAELAANADDPAVKQELEHVSALLTAASSASGTAVTDLAAAMKLTLLQRAAQLIVTVLFVGTCFLLPMLPASAGVWFWNFQLLQYPLPGLGLSVLNTALAALIVWRYLASPAWPSKEYDPDQLLDFSSETNILKITLGLTLIAVLYGPVEEVFTFSGSVPAYAGVWFPGINRAQWTTEILLLCAWATGLSLHRQTQWKAAPLALRRSSAVHNALVVLVASPTIWAGLVFFGQMQLWIHQKGGAWLFNNFGQGGNSAGDTLVALLTGAFTFAIVTGLRVLAGRAERFFTDQPTAQSQAQTRATTGASGVGR